MVLEYSDVLQTLAEVAITLTGFIGLILVFQRRGDSSYDKAHANTMFHLLGGSLCVLGLSLLPLLLQPAFEDSLTVWRICNPLMGISQAIGATRGLLEYRRGETRIPFKAVVILSAGAYLLFAITCAIALGYLPSFAALVYLLGLGWILVVAITSFISLVFQDAA